MDKMIIKCKKSGKIVDVLQKEGLRYNCIFRSLRNKDVKLNGKRIKENLEVAEGDAIEIFIEKSTSLNFEIVYEDENVYIVNKPKNIEIEGVGGLCEHLQAIAVHRLDRNTTGLVILAKNEKAKEILLQVFKNRWITKKYLCVVLGETFFKGEIFKGYLLKDSNLGKVTISTRQFANSKEISTKFKTLKNNNGLSLVECELLTGRTHQIRAQLSFLKHPIIGDGKYGNNEINKKYKEKYQKLHCFYLKINKINELMKNLQGKEFINYPDFFNQF